MTGDAFERFVGRHGADLARLAYQFGGNREEALDLVQEVFVDVFRHWAKVSIADNPSAYLRRMLVNEYLNQSRRRKNVTASHSDVGVLGQPKASPSHEVTYANRDAIWRAMIALTTRQRAAVVLRYYEDLDDSAISTLLNCRRSTVRSLIARGLESLRVSPELAVSSDDTTTRRLS